MITSHVPCKCSWSNIQQQLNFASNFPPSLNFSQFPSSRKSSFSLLPVAPTIMCIFSEFLHEHGVCRTHTSFNRRFSLIVYRLVSVYCLTERMLELHSNDPSTNFLPQKISLQLQPESEIISNTQRKLAISLSSHSWPIHSQLTLQCRSQSAAGMSVSLYRINWRTVIHRWSFTRARGVAVFVVDDKLFARRVCRMCFCTRKKRNIFKMQMENKYGRLRPINIWVYSLAEMWWLAVAR